jgi:hypothetical protein
LDNYEDIKQEDFVPEDEEEGEEVYMIDGVVMRMI